MAHSQVDLVGASMLAIVAAMSEELKDLRRLVAVEGVDMRSGRPVYRCTYRGRDLLLVQCGVGKRRAERTVRFVLDHYPVTAAVLLGFSGALNPGLKVGDVAACSTLRSAEGQEKEEYRCDDGLLSAAQVCMGARCQCGVGVSALGLIGSKEAKRLLAETSQADVVDMESYWIARIAAENHVPFMTVRSISDAATDSLPDLPSWRWTSMLTYLLLHPAPVFRLYRNTRRARRGLTKIGCHMIEVSV